MRSKNTETMMRIKGYCEGYVLSTGRSPSMADIARYIGMSRSSAYRYVTYMSNNGMLEYDGNEITTETSAKYRGNTVKAALIGSIRCGSPQYEEENIESYFTLPEELFGKGEFYCLHASGDSMIDAGIEDGDIVVCRKQLIADEGDIVVALVDGESNLKRFFMDRKKKCFILHPENGEYEDIIVEELYIQGVATHVIKKLGNAVGL